MSTAHWILGLAMFMLAVIGLAWVLARVFDGIERAWNWLRRDRVAPLLDDEDEAARLWADEEMDWMPPLPPERTWEQMTSHQLPLDGGGAQDWRAAEGNVPAPGRAAGRLPPGAADHFLRPPGYLAAERERRSPAWEVDHRAHYAAMGFDYPSGLMARVRELAP